MNELETLGTCVGPDDHINQRYIYFTSDSNLYYERGEERSEHRHRDIAAKGFLVQPYARFFPFGH